MSGSVLSVSSRALLNACDRLGLDTSRILRAAGVERAMVDETDSRIPTEQVSNLWRAAYELSGDPDLALHAIEVLPFGAYRVIDFIIWNAPTVGAALAKISDYFPLINNIVRLPFQVGEHVVTYAIDAAAEPAFVTRPDAVSAGGGVPAHLFQHARTVSPVARGLHAPAAHERDGTRADLRVPRSPSARTAASS